VAVDVPLCLQRRAIVVACRVDVGPGDRSRSTKAWLLRESGSMEDETAESIVGGVPVERGERRVEENNSRPFLEDVLSDGD